MPRSSRLLDDLGPRCAGSAHALAQLRRGRAERAHLLRRVVGVAHDAELLAVGVELVDEVRGNLDLAAVEVELAPLLGRRLDDLGRASPRPPVVLGCPSRDDRRLAVPSAISSSVSRTGSPSKSGSANSRVAEPV